VDDSFFHRLMLMATKTKMTRVIQEIGKRGSLKQIQRLINENQNLINDAIKLQFKELNNDLIYWKSPLKNDNYAEYKDISFIKKLGLNINEQKFNEFWPKRGVQWDAFATTNFGNIILVEAKANIPELISSPSAARYKSKTKIDKSLNNAKIYLGITKEVDWSAKYYQYTNRLAHLYFFRQICKTPAYLVNIYFTGDESVSGPKTQQEWEEAINALKSHLGISKHKLSEFTTNIFIDIKKLT